MKKLKQYIIIAAAVVILIIMFLSPQYLKEAAQALSIIMAEEQCGCVS